MAGGSAAWTWAISSRPVPVSSSGSSVIARTIADPPRALGGLRDRRLPAARRAGGGQQHPADDQSDARARRRRRLAEDEHGQADGGHRLDEEHDRGQGGRQAGEGHADEQVADHLRAEGEDDQPAKDGQDGRKVIWPRTRPAAAEATAEDAVASISGPAGRRGSRLPKLDEEESRVRGPGEQAQEDTTDRVLPVRLAAEDARDQHHAPAR